MTNKHVEEWRAPATMSQFASNSDLVMHVQRTGDNLAAEVERLEAELAHYKKYEFQPRPLLESVLKWRSHSKDFAKYSGVGSAFDHIQEQGDALMRDIELLTNENMMLLDKLKAKSPDALVIAPQLQGLIGRLKEFSDADRIEAANKLLTLFDLAYGTRTDGQPFLWKDVVDKIEKGLKAKLAKAHRAREAAEHARGVANLRAVVMERKNMRYKRRIAELETESACDVCKGTGRPFHDKSPCVCGGTGKMRDELEHFRRKLLFGDKTGIAPEKELMDFIEWTKCPQFRKRPLPQIMADLTTATTWLLRLHGRNEDLRRRLDGIHRMYQSPLNELRQAKIVPHVLDKDAERAQNVARAHMNTKIYICKKRKTCPNKACSYQREFNDNLFAPECADLEQVGGPGAIVRPKEMRSQPAIKWIESEVPLFICANRARPDWCMATPCRFRDAVAKGNSWPRCAKLEQVGGPTAQDLASKNADRKEDLLKSAGKFLDTMAGAFMTCPHCNHQASETSFRSPMVNVPGYYFCPQCKKVFHATQAPQETALEKAYAAMRKPLDAHVARVLKEKDSLVAHYLRASQAKPWDVEIVETQYTDATGIHCITYIRRKEKTP